MQTIIRQNMMHLVVRGSLRRVLKLYLKAATSAVTDTPCTSHVIDNKLSQSKQLQTSPVRSKVTAVCFPKLSTPNGIWHVRFHARATDTEFLSCAATEATRLFSNQMIMCAFGVDACGGRVKVNGTVGFHEGELIDRVVRSLGKLRTPKLLQSTRTQLNLRSS